MGHRHVPFFFTICPRGKLDTDEDTFLLIYSHTIYILKPSIDSKDKLQSGNYGTRVAVCIQERSSTAKQSK
jgi:hypothetical protein